jgi:hypothetical protein
LRGWKRLAYICISSNFVYFLKRFFQKKGGKRETKDQFLMAALFLSSFLIVIDHTLDTGYHGVSTIGIVVHYTNMGLFYWQMVNVHALYNITVFLSWYTNKSGLVLVLFFPIIVHITIKFFEKQYQSTLKMEGPR